jgi:hypothetical protein
MIDWGISVVQDKDGAYRVSIDRFTYRRGDDEGKNPTIETRILEPRFRSRDEAEEFRRTVSRARSWGESYFETGERVVVPKR